MEGYIILAVIVAIVFLFLIAREFYAIAEIKGFPELKYLWISFLFPVFGYLLVIALPDRNQRKVEETAPLLKVVDVAPPPKQTSSHENDDLPDL
ncbi:MAG: hypothetical protein J1E35_08305 [Lachnospiraceae bacterium]|nr:hypothetical protein [Lachnospiraceae bacterium]